MVVSCGAANSAKLLLPSANDKHPNGLANGSDQLGRNYMFHNSQAVLALSKEENPTVFQKTLGLNDFYFGERRLRVPDGQHPDGRQIAGADVPRREADRDQARAAMRTLEKIARHAVDFWLSTEDLPRPENRVTVDRDGRITLATRPPTRSPRSACYDQLKSMLDNLGMHEDHLHPAARLPQERDPGRRRGPSGGHLPLRHRPETSVLETDCRAHEVDNLYVVDTSFFPSIGAVNPALTAMANALRVGDHLLERLGAEATPTSRRRCLTETPGRRRRVVIVGGGFGGLAAARKLRRRRRRRHARRSHEPPPVPAAALPGGRGRRCRRANARRRSARRCAAATTRPC